MYSSMHNIMRSSMHSSINKNMYNNTPDGTSERPRTKAVEDQSGRRRLVSGDLRVPNGRAPQRMSTSEQSNRVSAERLK
jgi:hypothetical protein